MWSFEGYFKDFEFHLDTSGQPLKKFKVWEWHDCFFMTVYPLLGTYKSK